MFGNFSSINHISAVDEIILKSIYETLKKYIIKNRTNWNTLIFKNNNLKKIQATGLPLGKIYII